MIGKKGLIEEKRREDDTRPSFFDQRSFNGNLKIIFLNRNNSDLRNDKMINDQKPLQPLFLLLKYFLCCLNKITGVFLTGHDHLLEI